MSFGGERRGEKPQSTKNKKKKRKARQITEEEDAVKGDVWTTTKQGRERKKRKRE